MYSSYGALAYGLDASSVVDAWQGFIISIDHLTFEVMMIVDMIGFIRPVCDADNTTDGIISAGIHWYIGSATGIRGVCSGQ